MEDMKEERLDSPLIVHKKSDASYQETASEVGMSFTHTDEETEDKVTLERHRFKKDKKKKRWPWILLVLIAVAVAVICALYYNGIIKFGEDETTSATRKSYITQEVNAFEKTITVKGRYIFFEGEELDGIQELEKSIKYMDAGTKLTVQDENADSDYLNFDVLPLLATYDIDYETKHIVSSGLTSKYEVTEQTTENTTTQAVSQTESTTN